MLHARIISLKCTKFPCVFLNSSRLSHELALKDESCSYPPIVDMSFEGKRRNQRQIWYNSIKALPTVEEKLYEITQQTRPKLKKFSFSAIPNSYLAVDFQQYITRTHIIDHLPNKINVINVESELADIKDTLCEELRKFYTGKNLNELLHEQDSGSKLVKNFISQCYKKLALKNSYIMNSTVQTKPTIKSFWWHGGYNCKKKRLYNENLCFMFWDHPSLVIRIKEPLSPILNLCDPLCASADVPEFKYHPKTAGIGFERSGGLLSVPGFWTGDFCEYPFLLVYPADRVNTLLHNIDKYNLSKIEKSFGLTISFAWLNAISTYQGFTPFHDVTYPFVTHTILTNGQDWRFFVYQLNTVAFHADVDMKNRRNILWVSDKMRLFESVEDGQVKGVNDEVFKLLLKFLLNAPDKEQFRNVALKPYLNKDIRSENEKFYMKYFFRQIYSGAPESQAHREEIPHWKRIYKMHPEAPISPYLRQH